MAADVRDAIVIGAGQSGLATAYHLRKAGMRFLLLEASDAPGGSWPDYYDSLRLFSAVRYSSLPGLRFPGHPRRLPRRDEVTAYLRRYAEHYGFPIRTGTPVGEVERSDAAGDGFVVRSERGHAWRARAVVVATGAFRTPHVPAIPGLDAFRGPVVHSSNYRNPGPFLGKRVVVVGGGNSGVQIAAELAACADVTLATRRCVRFMRRRMLGMDTYFWLRWTGIERVRLLGRGASPVMDTGGYARMIRTGELHNRRMFDRATPEGVVWADGSHEQVDAVVLATGFRESFPFLDSMPGAAEHHRGMCKRVPGLAFVGRPGQSGLASATLRGSGRDAAYVTGSLKRWISRQGRGGPTPRTAVRWSLGR
tara:strand:+ start:53149 stop:54243 length:1095 start_codon:yes stop_codon:yes gene_type:complete